MSHQELFFCVGTLPTVCNARPRMTITQSYTRYILLLISASALGKAHGLSSRESFSFFVPFSAFLCLSLVHFFHAQQVYATIFILAYELMTSSKTGLTVSYRASGVCAVMVTSTDPAPPVAPPCKVKMVRKCVMGCTPGTLC